MNDTIVRTRVHKRSPLHFLVNGLEVRVSYLDQDGNGPFGVQFTWRPHTNTCNWLQHITEDGGYTYLQLGSSLVLGGDGVENRALVRETDPEKLEALQKNWTEYQKALRETVFSV